MGTPRYLSIFSGCGGLDLGFYEAGFSAVAAIDIDSRALGVLSDNIPGDTLTADLATLDPLTFSSKAIDVIVSGPPCQGFSTLGKRDLRDPRNDLLQIPAKFAEVLRPRVVLVENVPAVKYGKHKAHWGMLQAALRGIGYSVKEYTLDASNHSVAQGRKRVVLIAILGSFGPNLTFKSTPEVRLGDVLQLKGLSGDPFPATTFEIGSRGWMIAERIAQGQKLTNVRNGPSAVHTWDIPQVFGPVTQKERDVLTKLIYLRRRSRRRKTGDGDPIPKKDLQAEFGNALLSALERKQYLRSVGGFYDLTHTFNGKYRRLRAEGLAPTVNSHFGDPRYYLHPIEHRGFSLRETMRIQGFPDSFDVPNAVSRKRAFAMIANAVPPPMARAIARELSYVLGG
ncbi:MAG: DNA (cytosine-5-)-methyltransferase [Verrucomicrobia bacterium]|jgi:DNA (cytosine-5)-methyltransferase 1|nr:DNA (cytosine-5-)-methyltransferase [Verrucomicrobiota bacterium]